MPTPDPNGTAPPADDAAKRRQGNENIVNDVTKNPHGSDEPKGR
jgi:hypothetical protein